jgi:hypothetical protein
MSRINAKPRGKAFAPGNPGKPHGARHRVTRAVELLMEGEHEKLTRIAIDKALEGDTAALRLCLDRIARPRRDAPISIHLPPVRSAAEAAEAAEASAAVLASVAKGEVTPDEAGRIMALLASHKAMVAAGDLELRIAALEQAAR